MRSFWCKNDPEDPFRFSSISQNIFAVTREKQKSKRVRQTAIMKIYDFGTRDSGTYSCGLDYARSPVVLRPFSAPENDPFPVHILDLIPKTQELQGMLYNTYTTRPNPPLMIMYILLIYFKARQILVLL